MVMASIDVKIRHVFGFTFSWRAAPPVIVKLSGSRLVPGIDIGDIDRRLGPISVAN